MIRQDVPILKNMVHLLAVKTLTFIACQTKPLRMLPLLHHFQFCGKCTQTGMRTVAHFLYFRRASFQKHGKLSNDSLSFVSKTDTLSSFDV